MLSFKETTGRATLRDPILLPYFLFRRIILDMKK